MCFTLPGRLQTRCINLVGPAILTGIFALVAGKPDYWILFVLMFVCGVTLDLFVYSWLIGYQPRWLTLLLAMLEFFVIKWVMEWPYPFEIRLHTRQALFFYTLAWCMIWLTMHVVLPRFYPRWVEDAGEFRLRFHPRTRMRIFADLKRRRQIFLANMLIVLAGGMAWMIMAWLTPTGYVFTGLLASNIHYGALASATQAARGLGVYNLAGVIGWIAYLGRWPVFSVYQVIWLVYIWIWLLSAQLCYTRHSWFYLPLLVVPAILLPAPALMLAAPSAVLFAAGLRQHFILPKLHRLGRAVLLLAPILSLTVGLALARPFLYLEQGMWQSLIWMSQSIAPETVIATPDEQLDLVQSLGGIQASSEPTSALLLLSTSGTCPQSLVLFRHGDVCISALHSLREDLKT